MPSDEALELQVLGDIQDVFDSWRDDESSSDELEDDADASSPQHPASSSSSYLGIPPLRSQARLSKRTLAQALSALPAAPQAKRVKGAPSAAFAPFSTADYLERLASFNLLNFSGAAFPPSAAARAGWSSAGRDRLKCGCCEAAWKVSDFIGLKGVGREKLAAKMRTLLRDNHRPTCPWRVGIDLLDKAEPLQETALQPLRVAEVRRKADEMRPHLPDGLLLDHPLVRALHRLAYAHPLMPNADPRPFPPERCGCRRPRTSRYWTEPCGLDRALARLPPLPPPPPRPRHLRRPPHRHRQPASSPSSTGSSSLQPPASRRHPFPKSPRARAPIPRRRRASLRRRAQRPRRSSPARCARAGSACGRSPRPAGSTSSRPTPPTAPRARALSHSGSRRSPRPSRRRSRTGGKFARW